MYIYNYNHFLSVITSTNLNVGIVDYSIYYQVPKSNRHHLITFILVRGRYLIHYQQFPISKDHYN